ncbi:hypothetical protein HN747_03650 [archaeon]|nr:hypothetical protein [archaeon]
MRDGEILFGKKVINTSVTSGDNIATYHTLSSGNMDRDALQRFYQAYEILRLRRGDQPGFLIPDITPRK